MCYQGFNSHWRYSQVNCGKVVGLNDKRVYRYRMLFNCLQCYTALIYIFKTLFRIWKINLLKVTIKTIYFNCGLVSFKCNARWIKGIINLTILIC